MKRNHKSRKSKPTMVNEKPSFDKRSITGKSESRNSEKLNTQGSVKYENYVS